MPQVLALAALGCGLLFAGGCTSDDDIPTSKIFTSPPWQDGEQSVYRVTDEGVDGVGTCTLETHVDFEPGHTKLARSCENGPYRDDGSAVVDSATLVPVSSTRTAFDGTQNRSSTYTVDYNGPTAHFKADINGAVRETDRDLPKPDEQSPDPGWYDDESLLWLARGITLQEGWSGGYWHVINAGQPRILQVRVTVEKQEQVKEPAGTFQAWRVRFEREDTVYFVWVDVAAPHRVVQAQIEDVKYELSGTG